MLLSPSRPTSTNGTPWKNPHLIPQFDWLIGDAKIAHHRADLDKGIFVHVDRGSAADRLIGFLMAVISAFSFVAFASSLRDVPVLLALVSKLRHPAWHIADEIQIPSKLSGFVPWLPLMKALLKAKATAFAFIFIWVTRGFSIVPEFDSSNTLSTLMSPPRNARVSSTSSMVPVDAE